MNNTPFIVIEDSPWPLVTGTAALFIATSAFLFLQGVLNGLNLFFIGFILLVISMIVWFRDILRESIYEGRHTLIVKRALKHGIILFIVTEALFFVSFFWAFFHSSLAPSVELASQWPPMGIHTLDPLGIPLLNTLILVTSGSTATWAHHATIMHNRKESIIGFTLTIILGISFTILQAKEYFEAPFTITDSIYGTTFFVATGFHGLHVLIGTLLLYATHWRLYQKLTNSWTHIGMWAAIMYWHFVDVVWLYLYISLYFWAQ